MCLQIKNFKPGREYIKTAKRDIHVYKVLSDPFGDRWLTTPYRHHAVSSPIMETVKFGVRTRRAGRWRDEWVADVHRGIHAFRKLDVAILKMCSVDRLHKAIIPKGTKYIIGEAGDIVCLSLIIGEEIDKT